MRKQGNRRRAFASGLAAGIAALALSLSLLGSASAETTVVPNGLVINTVSTGGTTTYSGQVFGAKFCRAGRRVDVYVNGVLGASLATNSDGSFSFSGPTPPPGTEVRIVATKKVKKTKKGKKICQQKVEVKKVQQ